mgnify:FL=1
MLTHLVQTIKARARELGMTDTELARRAGITKSSLSRLGKQHGARVDTIQTLAEVVGLTLTLSPKNDHARSAIEGTLLDISKWKP